MQTIYYSDPDFKIFKVPEWRAKWYKFFSVNMWGALPSPTQRMISSWYSKIYDQPYSKKWIDPYVRWHYSDKDYLSKFKPPFGKTAYDSFQDFFIREFKALPKTNVEVVWPCEGLLCDGGSVGAMKTSTVKSDTRTIATIFGVEEGRIPFNYSFTNVFLHNKNYHRIHAPINGTITRIQHIPGDLVVLRPWIYKQNPSLPAFRNERYNIDLVDHKGQTWYLSIVGGPAVGTIALNKGIELGATVAKLDELALFYLGSTCCMAAPLAPSLHDLNTFVEVGAQY